MKITDEEIRRVKQRWGIVGNSPALLEAVARAMRVAPIDLSVLVTGESGSGKEFFPKIIHSLSARKHAGYIAVNCGAIPEGTIDSELFGHEKGSFTGAVSSRKGYFEEADGGTIFLDEVAELPLTTQARLLRVIETGEYIRVGSSTVRRTNIRVVAATNVDMAKAVREGKFREDLYYRLSTVLITVPPLRDRDGDIILLARKFAADFAERYQTPEIEFDAAARQLLMRYRWPGNVRQLKNVIDQIALFDAGDVVTHDQLERYLPSVSTAVVRADSDGERHRDSRYEAEREMLLNLIFRLQGEIDDLRAMVTGADKKVTTQALAPIGHADHAPLSHLSERDLHEDENTTDVTPSELDADDERSRIAAVLDRHDGRRAAAAAELGISERTLYRKIRDLGL